MKKTFNFEFEEEKHNRLTYECSLDEDERLETSVENGVPFIYLNRSAMITMAKILIKMANGPYSNGFHLHLHKDFNEDAPDAVVLLLASEEEKVSSDSKRGDRMGVVDRPAE
jgi:hypothetical protein